MTWERMCSWGKQYHLAMAMWSLVSTVDHWNLEPFFDKATSQTNVQCYGNLDWQENMQHIRMYYWKFILMWLVVWTCFIFPYIVNNHPNWRSHIFQRGGSTTNQIRLLPVVDFHPYSRSILCRKTWSLHLHKFVWFVAVNQNYWP